MDSDTRGLSPAGQPLNVGALLQGASLLVLLGLFGVGTFLAFPGAAADNEPYAEPAAADAPGDQLGSLPRHPDTHLVIIVDSQAPGSAAEFLRQSEAGMEWVVSVEIMNAAEVSPAGLEEALTMAAAICPIAGCPELKVLDLRVRDPGAP